MNSLTFQMDTKTSIAFLFVITSEGKTIKGTLLSLFSIYPSFAFSSPCNQRDFSTFFEKEDLSSVTSGFCKRTHTD